MMEPCQAGLFPTVPRPAVGISCGRCGFQQTISTQPLCFWREKNLPLRTWVVPCQLSSEYKNSPRTVFCCRYAIKSYWRLLSSAVALCLGKRGAHPAGERNTVRGPSSALPTSKCWSREGIQAVLSMLRDSNWGRNKEVTKGLGIGHKISGVNIASLLTSNNSGIVRNRGYLRPLPWY